MTSVCNRESVLSWTSSMSFEESKVSYEGSWLSCSVSTGGRDGPTRMRCFGPVLSLNMNLAGAAAVQQPG